MRRILVALALLWLATDARAATAADLRPLDWLAGDWIMEKDGIVTRETWLTPVGATMAGVTQTSRPGRPTGVEFATITAEATGVTFVARVKGQPPTAFVLKPGGEGEAVFENLAHDFPQRVIYRRCDQDLCARIEGLVKKELKSVEWRYRPVR